jgi:hypothetical protein
MVNCIEFRIRCPNGEEQVIDPIIEPGFDPTIYTFTRYKSPEWQQYLTGLLSILIARQAPSLPVQREPAGCLQCGLSI